MPPKDSYYFPHDSNARHDPRISAMRCEYGNVSYGWYWILIEMMREQTDYRLRVNGRSTKVYAKELDCTEEEARRFIDDCMTSEDDGGLGLFETDGTYFWSPALLRRMDHWEEVRAKRAEAGRQGGRPKKQMKSNCFSNEKQKKAMKGKEIKESKEDKNIVPADRHVYHLFEQSFLSKNTDFDFKREGKHLQQLEQKALARDSPTEFAKRVLVTFWRMTHGGDKFYSKQPFLPSALNSGGIWPRVLKQMENESAADDLDDEIARVFG